MKNLSFKKHISVDCVIFGYNENDNKLEVLLIEQMEPSKNATHPYVPQFALPGDLVNEDESLDDAAIRVLKELTHVEGLQLRQFYSFGDPMRVKQDKDKEWLKFYRSDPEARVITVSYYTLVRKEIIKAMPGSFAKNVVWKNIKRVPALAFDHNQIVKKAIEDIQDRIYQNDIAQQLLPKKFTLRQLQNLYEVVLNIEFDKRNFIKRIKRDEELIHLDEKQKGVLHKPAQLFSFKTKKRRAWPIL
jgi:8-oxo-dGTP diphosphatase